jgi:hypothetical protein
MGIGGDHEIAGAANERAPAHDDEQCAHDDEAKVPAFKGESTTVGKSFHFE